MISPQKLPKSLGKTQLSLGVSIRELVILSFVPMTFNFLGFEPFVSLLTFLGMIGFVALKNKLMPQKSLQHAINKKSHLKWRRVDYK